MTLSLVSSASLDVEPGASPLAVARPPVGSETLPALADDGSIALPPRTHIAERRYTTHQKILLDCDPESRLLEILEGTVILTRILTDGRRQVLEILSPGMLIGIPRAEQPMVFAETRSHVRVRIHDMKDGGPASQLRVLYAEQMNARLQALHELTLSMGQKTAPERVASFLLGLGGLMPLVAAEMPDAAPREVRLHLSQTDIADYLGLRSETVCRAFTALKRDKLIAQPGQGRLTLCNVAEIAARAEPAYPAGRRDGTVVVLAKRGARARRPSKDLSAGAA